MSGLTDAERLGLWLTENKHEVISVARCTRGDGRVLAKVCEVEGLRWVWFAGFRNTRGALIAELEELLPLPTQDGSGPEELQALIDGLPATGNFQSPPQAFPDGRTERVVVNCPGCRARFLATYENGTLSVAHAPERTL